MTHRAIYRFLRLLLVITSCILFYFIAKYTILYLYPFLIAIVVSFFMQRPIRFLETKMHLPRAFAWFIVFITGVSGILFLIIFLTAELMQGTAFLAVQIPKYFRFFADFIENTFETTFLPLYNKFISIFHTLSNNHQEIVLGEINKITEQFSATGASFIHQALLKIPSFLALLPGSLTIMLFTILATIFISKDWNQLHLTFKNIVPSAANSIMQKVTYQFKKTLLGYVKSQFILVLVTACIIYVGLLILQIKHALTIALLTSIVDFLPFIGTGIVFVPWILYLFFTNDYTLTIFISILYMVVILQRQLSEPKIVSSSIGLPPLVILLCLFLAWQFWGLMGIFMAPLLLIVITTLIRADVFTHVWGFIKG